MDSLYTQPTKKPILFPILFPIPSPHPHLPSPTFSLHLRPWTFSTPTSSKNLTLRAIPYGSHATSAAETSALTLRYGGGLSGTEGRDDDTACC